MKKILIVSSAVALMSSAGAHANEYLNDMGGYLGWQFGTSDQVLLTGADDVDADTQGFIFGLDYQDTYYLDASLTKRTVDGSVDLDVMEFDAGYRYRFDDKLYAFGSLGVRSVDEDELPSAQSIKASGLAAKAGAGIDLTHSTKMELGVEYFDESLDIGDVETDTESEANAFVSGAYSPGDNFEFTVGYRALYKQTFFEVTYNF